MKIYFKDSIITQLDVEKSIDEIFNNFNLQPLGDVFIKPNFSGRFPIIKSENTSIEILDAVVKKLESIQGVKRVLIGHYSLLSVDKSSFDFDTMINLGGYKDLLKYSKVSFANLDLEAGIEIDIMGFKCYYPKILDNVDFFINMPKIKTHMETGVSLSIKNLMGLVDDRSRKLFHKTNLNEMLGYLGIYFKPNINIMDGLIAMEGNGPHEGENKIINSIISGIDMVELDSFISSLMGINFTNVLHIKKAMELGVGNYASNEILSQYKDKIWSDYKKPDLFMRFGKKIFFWPTTSCSLCHEVMRLLKKKLKSNLLLGLKFYYYAYFSKKRINIILGRCEFMEYFVNDKNICIGICTRNYAEKNNLNCLIGCPPQIENVINFIFKELKV
ncbi:MAG: DUF362 domain-containing protein [Patescibacteria group bacterium]|nr:DUF362 domain-containing protein [Patescibacteria group bacterium]HNV97274.1 DUF362 domain-containing protein [bacterium]